MSVYVRHSTGIRDAFEVSSLESESLQDKSSNAQWITFSGQDFRELEQSAQMASTDGTAGRGELGTGGAGLEGTSQIRAPARTRQAGNLDTTHTIDGHRVKRYLGIESVEFVIGTGLFSEDTTNFRTSSARSTAFERKLQRPRRLPSTL